MISRRCCCSAKLFSRDPLRIQLVKFSVIISWSSPPICNHDYSINNTSILIIATSFESSESSLLHHINNMSFAESTSELVIVQEEKKTRVDANVLISKSKKRRFIVLKQKKVIQTSESDYTSFITSIYRSFQLHHAYMTFWKFVQLFLFLLQSIFDLLFHHINQTIYTLEINWNALTMMKLRQWVAIRILMTQNLAKNATIQSFWFQKSLHNSSFSRDRYQITERHLNVEFNQQMSYNNASWFWKIEIALNVFRFRLFSFTSFESHFAIDEFAIEFHDRMRNKFRLAHKWARESFVLYSLISDRDILHDFMLWESRDDFEYHKNDITMNISSRTTRKRKKNTTEITAMKINLSFTKKVVYILCERITRNLRHHHFVCFIDNLFTNSHFVKVLLTLNVDICDIVRDNASDISLKLKEITAATKSQLNLEQWIHRIVNEVINCFVWRNFERDHVISSTTIAYTSCYELA